MQNKIPQQYTIGTKPDSYPFDSKFNYILDEDKKLIFEEPRPEWWEEENKKLKEKTNS